MKIKPEHYKHMRDAIAQIPRELIEAHIANLHKDNRVKNLDKRLRWDLLHSVMPAVWVCDNIYPYANDTHLDTALRTIVKELEICSK